jgi:hypothetical protein
MLIDLLSPPDSRNLQYVFSNFLASALIKLFKQLSHDINQQAKQRNRELAACRLPEDLYSLIFMECAQLPLKNLESWSWMNVSYVCSTWRNAALRCQRLWAFVDFTCHGRIIASLDRAKGLPLSIRTVANQRNYRQLRSVFTTAHQIREIHIDSSFDDIQPLLESLAHPNPTLISLTINVLSTDSSHCYSRPIFPSCRTLPNLQTAQLNAAPLYLLSPNCPSLTDLTLCNLPHSESRSDVLKLLSSLSQIRRLTVLQCTMPRGSLPAQVHLPNLLYLKVGGSLEQVADFLEFITITPSCQLCCSLHQVDKFSDNLWRFCQSIGSFSSASNEDMPIETLVLTCDEESTRFTTSYEPNPEFRQSIRIRAFGPKAKLGRAAFDITIGPGDQTISDDIMIRTLSGILRALVLTRVQTLSMQNIDVIPQKAWTELLRALPQLRVLVIRGYAPFGLAWALLTDVSSIGPGIPRFLIPRLDDVYLHDMDCSSGSLMVSPKEQVNSHSNMDDSKFIDVLVTCLKRRRRHKLGLRSLTVTRCDRVSQKVLENARRLVPHLVWDIRGRMKQEPSASYRNIYPGVPRNDARHYERLKVLTDENVCSAL